METNLIRTTLSNGVRLIAEPMEGTRTVALTVALACGSRHEDDSENGMTHFGEHLLFKGTPQHHWKALAREMNLLGGNVNASTSTDSVRLYATVTEDDMEEALSLLASMFLHSTFPDDEVSRERQVILEEIAMYDDIPDDLCYERFTQALLLPHPAGRPVLGPSDGVSVYTGESLRNFWKSRLIPSRLVISAAGYFDRPRLEAQCEKLFGGLSDPGTRLNGGNGSRLKHETIAIDRDLEQINFCFGTSGPEKKTPKRYAWALYDTILGGGMGSRLFDEVREKRGLAYSVGSAINAMEGLGFLAISGSTRAEYATEAIKVCYAVLRDLAENGVQEDEMETAKRQIQRMIILGQEHPGARASLMAERELFDLDHLTVDEVVSRLYAVTLDDVKDVANEVTNFGDPSACFVGPLAKANGLESIFKA